MVNREALKLSPKKSVLNTEKLPTAAAAVCGGAAVVVVGGWVWNSLFCSRAGVQKEDSKLPVKLN